MAFSVRGRVAAIPDRVLDARLIACLLQPIGCARLNDMCVHDGTMGQMLPSTDSAIWERFLAQRMTLRFAVRDSR